MPAQLFQIPDLYCLSAENNQIKSLSIDAFIKAGKILISVKNNPIDKNIVNKNLKEFSNIEL